MWRKLDLRGIFFAWKIIVWGTFYCRRSFFSFFTCVRLISFLQNRFSYEEFLLLLKKNGPDGCARCLVLSFMEVSHMFSLLVPWMPLNVSTPRLFSLMLARWLDDFGRHVSVFMTFKFFHLFSHSCTPHCWTFTSLGHTLA